MSNVDSNSLQLLRATSESLSRSGVHSYLVGGFVRDLLLERQTNDIDIAVSGNSLRVAKTLAGDIGGKYVVLDEDNRVARVVMTGREKSGYIDITAFSEDIKSDLFRRDFSIDAMALDLQEFIRGSREIIDPFDGLADLKKQVVRMVHRRVFAEDGIRLLRAVRLAAELKFQIEGTTEDLIKRENKFLENVPGERIREELVRLFSTAGSGGFFSYLDKLGLLLIIFPEMSAMKNVTQPGEHYWNVFDHSLKTVESAEFLLREAGWILDDKNILETVIWSDEIHDHFNREIVAGSKRSLMLKLGALFHDIAKPQTKATDDKGRLRFIGHPQQGASITRTILNRLRFSNREIKVVEHLVRYHLRPVQMSNVGMPTNKAIYRFFRDTGDDGIDILFLALADYLATAGPRLKMEEWKQHNRLIAYIQYEHDNQAIKRTPVKLVDGNELMEEFSLTPGPQIGKLLDLVHEAQATGEITSREEAFALARKVLSKRESDTGCNTPVKII
jgi:poly(A) polymerase